MLKATFTLLALLVFGVYDAFGTPNCQMLSYSPPSPFRFAQQIFWDPRTLSIYVADCNVPSGSPSLFRFDWKSETWHSATVMNPDTTKPISFVVPAASSPHTLIVGQNPCVTRINWDGLSSTATKIDDIACRNPDDVNDIDRGATSPSGILYMSILPKRYCNKTDSYPSAAVEYLDIASCPTSVRSSLTPGTYSNGIVFDAAAGKAFIAEDCSSSVLAYRWNPKDNSMTYLESIFKFPRDKVTTNYPSGMVIDQCSNIYVGDHNSGRVYAVNSKTKKLIKKYTVPGTHITAVGIVGTDLDYLCVITGIDYHDSYGNLRSTSTDPGDGKMYLIPINSECSGCDCKGKPAAPIAGY